MRIFRIITAILLVGICIFSFTIGVNNINALNPNFNPTTYKGVITLWQVDSFEGGRGSRKQFLLDTAVGFEKQNKGVLVMVTNYTKEGVEDNLKQGIKPDLISFSHGVSVDNPIALNLPSTANGGKLGQTTYFVPWCRGGYVLICNPKFHKENAFPTNVPNLLVSSGEYTQPLIALIEQEINVDKIEELPPMDAYIKFTNGNVEYFLATQRDVCRLQNRGMDFIAYPLTKYNDLYQYIGLTCTDGGKVVMAEKFIEYLISEKVQQNLTKISMLSTFYKVNYMDKTLDEMQKASGFKTISIFTSKAQLKNLQDQSRLAMGGSEEYKNKIKNVLI